MCKWQLWVLVILYGFMISWIHSSYGFLAAFLVIVILAPIKLQIIMITMRAMIKAHFREGRHIVDG